MCSPRICPCLPSVAAGCIACVRRCTAIRSAHRHNKPNKHDRYTGYPMSKIPFTHFHSLLKEDKAMKHSNYASKCMALGVAMLMASMTLPARAADIVIGVPNWASVNAAAHLLKSNHRRKLWARCGTAKRHQSGYFRSDG